MKTTERIIAEKAIKAVGLKRACGNRGCMRVYNEKRKNFRRIKFVGYFIGGKYCKKQALLDYFAANYPALKISIENSHPLSWSYYTGLCFKFYN